jgi:hypothetical protein
VTVYFIQPPVPKVKIGYTDHECADARLKALQCGNHERLHVSACITGAHQSIERALHKHFEDLWLHGEWFNVNDELESLMCHIRAGKPIYDFEPLWRSGGRDRWLAREIDAPGPPDSLTWQQVWEMWLRSDPIPGQNIDITHRVGRDNGSFRAECYWMMDDYVCETKSGLRETALSFDLAHGSESKTAAVWIIAAARGIHGDYDCRGTVRDAIGLVSGAAGEFLGEDRPDYHWAVTQTLPDYIDRVNQILSPEDFVKAVHALRADIIKTYRLRFVHHEGAYSYLEQREAA